MSGVSKDGAAGGARGASRRSAEGFSVGGTGAGASAPPAAAASAAAAVGLSLLAAQEDGGGRSGGTRRRACSILDELRGLQAELLGGRADPSRLARLAALQSGEEGADPGLRKAVRAVALRARVELARRGLDTVRDRSATVP